MSNFSDLTPSPDPLRPRPNYLVSGNWVRGQFRPLNSWLHKNQGTFHQPFSFPDHIKRTPNHRLIKASYFRNLCDRYIVPLRNHHKKSTVCLQDKIWHKKPYSFRTVSLRMGRSSLTIKDISVHLRVIDSDHVEEIIVLI